MPCFIRLACGLVQKLTKILLKLEISDQDSNHSYCTSAGLACAKKVAKEAPDCKTTCAGLYVDVFRADDTKLTTDVMKIGNMIHGLAKKGY